MFRSRRMNNKTNSYSSYDLCRALTAVSGTSGDEEQAADTAMSLLAPFGEVKTDALSNVCASINESGKIKVLLDAHLDRIGLVVRGVDDGGFILFDKVGGVDERTLVGAEVTVYGEKPLFGVIGSTPPHLLKDGSDKSVKISDLAIDIGMSAEEAEKYVRIGDRITVVSVPCSLLGNTFSCAALDNRSGCAAVIRAVSLVHEKLKNVSLFVLLSAQEETGGSGAKTGAFISGADFAICVDVGFGDDSTTDKSETISLGGGPSIGISPVLDRELMLTLKRIAKENNIPVQHDVMPGRTGTNADQLCIAKGGVKTALLSIPLRYMHTCVETVNTIDVDNTAKLIEKFILNLEENADA